MRTGWGLLWHGLAPLVMTMLLTMPSWAVRSADSVSHFTLDNGLEIVVIEDHRAPVVTHMLWKRAGSADEPAGKSGIAHFLEHLMFKGTETRDPGEFSALVEAQGGRDNAFTSFDYTAYFQRVAADRLELMMELEADRLANLSFTEAEWLPERDVILEERGQVVESRPGALFGEQMRAALFQNHRYGIPIIGWRHEMEGLTDTDAMAFFDAHYGPNNAILVVAGAVHPEMVHEMALRHYGPIPANPAITPRARPQEPGALAKRRIAMQDSRVAQPYMMRLYRVPSRRPGDQDTAAALQVLALLLGGSPSTSVLAQSLTMGADAPALSASAYYSGRMVDDGTFGLVVVPAEGTSLAEAEAALDEAIARFADEGIDPAQLERARTRILANEIFTLDNATGRARALGATLAVGLGLDDYFDWPERLLAVEPDDVMAALALLDPLQSVTGTLEGTGEATARGGGGVVVPIEEVSQ